MVKTIICVLISAVLTSWNKIYALRKADFENKIDKNVDFVAKGHSSSASE